MSEKTKESPKFAFNWRDFCYYGLIWIAVFVVWCSVVKTVSTIVDQQRQIQDLIDRLHQYDDPDFTDRDKIIPPFNDEKNGKEENTSLSTWVKQNLPKDGVDERADVAEVFSNLADMLDDGTLKGEMDAFNEGISQLQPVATRRIWLPFLTKLTKKLHKQNLDNVKLASAFRIIAKSIDPSRSNASFPPLEAFKAIISEYQQNSLSNAQEDKPDYSAETNKTPSQNQAEEPKTGETVEERVSDPESTEKATETEGKTSNCQNGNCPNPGYYQQGYYWRYF